MLFHHFKTTVGLKNFILCRFFVWKREKPNREGGIPPMAFAFTMFNKLVLLTASQLSVQLPSV